jgi:hypothetical protein
MCLPEDIAARASWLRSGNFADRVKTQECLVLTEAAKEIIESHEFHVRCYHPDNHGQLRQHLRAFLAYNFGEQLKTLQGLTPFESICAAWTKESDRFRLDKRACFSGPS